MIALPIYDCRFTIANQEKLTIGNLITFQTSQWVGLIGPPKHF